MSIFNIFKKKQKKNNVSEVNVSKEMKVTVPILPTIGPVTPENPKMKEEDLSEEEIEKLIEPIQKYEVREMRRRSVFDHLPYEYNQAIKRKVEENYKTGKIEEFPLCKQIYAGRYEELIRLYPEEMAHLEDIYLPVYEEYMKEYLYKDGTNFNDLTEFAAFIEKINYFEGSMISDQYFNIVNDALRRYGKEFYGDRLSGIVKEYFFEYDKYLKVKDNIMSEIEILMSENRNDDEKRDAVIKIKSKGVLYLSKTQGEYIV